MGFHRRVVQILLVGGSLNNLFAETDNSDKTELTASPNTATIKVDSIPYWECDRFAESYSWVFTSNIQCVDLSYSYE